MGLQLLVMAGLPFEEGTVSVVDLDPTSENWHQEIERLK